MKFLCVLLVAATVCAALAADDDRSTMLKLVADWDCKDPSWTPNTSVCKWAGVTCDPNNFVEKFEWRQNACTGSVNLTNLFPLSVLDLLDLSGNLFKGTPDLTQLPKKLQTLLLHDNNFVGTPDLTKLPQGLKLLTLFANNLAGRPDLTQLPLVLEDLNMYGNHFSGTLNILHLPASLKKLYLAYNNYSGTLDLTRLPPYIEHVALSDNLFEGPLDLTKLPKSIQLLDLSASEREAKNRFCGSTTSSVGCSPLVLPKRWCSCNPTTSAVTCLPC